MKIHVLGSAAGGGFPQWNCGCPNCRHVRRAAAGQAEPAAKPRTQSSVAISSDGDSWFLLNASPEVRAQVESFPALHPRAARHSPIAGIVLTNGDLDHCLGLLSLREWQPLRIYATPAVRRGFTQNNVLYRTLERVDGQVRFVDLKLGQITPLLGPDEKPSGLTIEPVAAPGKVPIHLESSNEPSPEDNVGLLVRQAGQHGVLAYFPAVASPTPSLRSALATAQCCLFDGTFWSSDELIALGLGEKRAEEMAHWPVGGQAGSLSMLRELGDKRRILIHINNTNPILLESSPQAQELRASGVEVAYDGMEIAL